MRLKDSVLRLVQRTGACSLVAGTRWRRDRLAILCYHGVSLDDEHAWRPQLYVSQDRLRERLRLLRTRGYAILPLAAAVRQLFDGTLPPRAVALTFDDGAADFAERAVPVLREFDAPATVYLTTYYCERQLPIFDTAIDYVLWRMRHGGADVAPIARSSVPLPIALPAARTAAWSAMKAYAEVARLDALGKDRLLRELCAHVAYDYDDFTRTRKLTIMRPDVVRALPRDLVDVQLHTHRHRTPLDRVAFHREIVENRTRIAAILGEGPLGRHFCYPNGECVGEFVEWLGELGVESATTGVPSLATQRSHRLLLPRFVDGDHVPIETVEAWLSGVTAFLPRRREFRLAHAEFARYMTPVGPVDLEPSGGIGR